MTSEGNVRLKLEIFECDDHVQLRDKTLRPNVVNSFCDCTLPHNDKLIMTTAALEQEYFSHDLDSFIDELMREWKVPGLSIAVIQDNDIAAKGYGFTRSGGTPVTPDTPFDSASMSKSFTAAAIACLVDDNERYPDVQWSTPISKLMPDDFVLHDPYLTQNVTLVDALSHRIGIPRNDEATIGREAAHPDTPKIVCRKLRHLPATKPFRTHFLYNNLVYTSIAHLIKVLSTKSLPEVLEERFFGPLGMNRTFFNGHPPENVKESEIAQGSCWDEKSKQYIPVRSIWGAEGYGAGEIMSSANDWAKWVRSQIQRSNGISDESLTELFEPRILADPEPKDDDPHEGGLFYAMGWHVEYYKGHKVLQHGGSMTGFSSFMAFLPKRKFGFVMYANSEGLDDAHEIIAYRLIDECLKTPPAQRSDWNKFFLDKVQRDREEREKELEELFPDRPDEPLPMTLPLDAYTGDFDSPGYGTLTVSIKDGNLFVNATDRTYRLEIRFEHVSANFFIVRLYGLPSTEPYSALEAEFRINVAGAVDKLGIDFVGEDGGDIVWFQRVAK